MSLGEAEDFWVSGQAARQCDPLLLAPRELARQPLGVGRHMHECEHFLDAGSNARARPVMGFEPIGDVLPHAHVREERVTLENNADAAPVGRQVVDTLIVKQHAAVALANETGNNAQQRRFSASRWSKQSDELTAMDDELHIADRDKNRRSGG